MMAKLDPFLHIMVPGHTNVREWADKWWDTYGFDYDTERCARGQLWAWPCDVSLDELKANLDAAGIQYVIHEFDSNVFFGLD